MVTMDLTGLFQELYAFEFHFPFYLYWAIFTVTLTKTTRKSSQCKSRRHVDIMCGSLVQYNCIIICVSLDIKLILTAKSIYTTQSNRP